MGERMRGERVWDVWVNGPPPTHLDANEAVLHDVDAADAVGPRHLVEVQKSLQRVGEGGARGLVDHLAGRALLELDAEERGLRGMGMWKAAKNGSKGWFIAIFIINSAGILPILYIYIFGKKKK